MTGTLRLAPPPPLNPPRPPLQPLPWVPPPFAGQPREVLVTDMQRNILESLCEGKNNRLIGSDWGITENTVKCHVSGVIRLVGARDRAHLVALIRSGEVMVAVKPAPGWTRPDPPVTATLSPPATYPPAL